MCMNSSVTITVTLDFIAVTVPPCGCYYVTCILCYICELTKINQHIYHCKKLEVDLTLKGHLSCSLGPGGGPPPFTRV